MAKEQKFTREALLRAEFFSQIQPDFLNALLSESEYTIPEAKKIVEDYFNIKIGGEQ